MKGDLSISGALFAEQRVDSSRIEIIVLNILATLSMIKKRQPEQTFWLPF